MSLNFGGLGFSFTAKDAGFSKATEYMAGKLKNLGGAMDATTAFGGKMADNFRGVFDKIKTQAAALPQAFRDLKDTVASSVSDMLDPMTTLSDRQRLITQRFNDAWYKAGDGITKFTGRLRELGTTAGTWLMEKTKAGAIGFRKAMQDVFSGQGTFARGIARMRDGVLKLKDSLNPSAIKGFFKEFGGKAIDAAKGHLEGLHSAQKNLTTGAEAEGAQLAMEARKTAANLGYTGKELDKVTGKAAGMAKSLDIGAEEAAKAIYNFGWAEEQFKALGLKSASDLAKFTSSFSVDQGKFTETLAIMQKELKITSDELPGLAGAFIAYGRSAGDVGGSLNDMEDAVKKVRGQAALLGRDLDPKQMAGYVKQQASLTGIIYSATQDIAGAKALSAAFTEKSVESQKNLRDMFAGTADDLSDFQKELSVLGLNVGDSMKLMEQGPEGMMMALAQMSQEARKSEAGWGRFTQFVGGRLGKVLGDEQTDQFINALRNMDATTIQMSQDAAKASADLGKMAKEAWRSSKTLADAFDSAQDALVSRFRKIGRSAAVDFVKESVKAFNQFGDSLEAVAKEGGPMGKVVTKLSEIHQIGALALVPKEMRGFASVLGTVVENAGPAVTALGSLGFRFSTLANPAVLLGTAIAFIAAEFASLWLQTKSADKAFALLGEKLTSFGTSVLSFGQKAGNAILDFLVSTTARMAAFATKFDWSKFFTSLFSSFGAGAKGMSGTIQAALGDLWGVLEAVFSGKTPQAQTRLGKIAGSLLVAVRSIFEGLGAALGKVDWSGLLGRVFSALGAALGQVKQVFAKIPWGTIFGGLFSVLQKLLGVLAGDTVWSFINTIAGFMVARAKILGDGIVALIVAAADFLGRINWSAVLGGLARKIVDTLAVLIQGVVPILAKAFKALPVVLGGVVKLVVSVIKNLPTQFAGLLMTIGNRLREILPGLTKTLAVGLGQLVKWIAMEGVPMLVGALPFLLDGLMDLTVGLGSLLLDILVGIGEGLCDVFADLWEEIKPELEPLMTWFRDLWGDITFGATGAWDLVRSAGKRAWDGIKAVWSTVAGFFSDLGDILVAGSAITWGQITGLGTDAWEAIQGVWSTVSGFFGDLFSTVGDLAMSFASSMITTLAGLWTDHIQPIWQGFVDYVSGLFTTIGSLGSSFVDGFVAIFTGAADTVRGLFDGIFGKVEELFGHSVNTVVGADMDKTVGVVQDAAGQIQHDLEVSLFDAITRALQNAFQTAFTKIADTTKEFVKKETDLIAGMVDSIKMHLTRTVSEVVSAIDVQFSAMERRVTSLVRELRTVEAEISRATAERAQEQSRLVDEQKKLENLKATAATADEKLLRTIDYPGWWPLYEAQFNARMEAQRAATMQAAGEIKAAIYEMNTRQAQRTARVLSGQSGDNGANPYIPSPNKL